MIQIPKTSRTSWQRRKNIKKEYSNPEIESKQLKKEEKKLEENKNENTNIKKFPENLDNQELGSIVKKNSKEIENKKKI